MTDRISSKKNINESVAENKNIPYGKDFSSLLPIYKVVEDDDAEYYINGYDRKQTKGWNNRGADSYGIVGYTHLHLSGAMQMIGSYGNSIIMFKLLGGLKNFVFFNTNNPEIKKHLVKSYGRDLSLEEQLYELTGDMHIAKKYGNVNPVYFGKTAQHEIRRAGYYLRGMVCEYWNDASDIVVYPFNFGDMITCAIASGLSWHDSEETIKSRFVGVLDQKSRDKQNNFLDIVPHLEVLNAMDPDGCQYTRVGETAYASYETMDGKYNMAIIDDAEWASPKTKKMFPDTIRLDEMPSNPSRRGNFYFIMNGTRWNANVEGISVNGQTMTNDAGENVPIFWRYDRPDIVFSIPDHIEWIYSNPNWLDEYIEENERQYKQVNEAFTPGMSYEQFTKENRAIGYVCTHSWSVNGILKHGFSREWTSENDKKCRGGNFYGSGVYGAVILGNPFSYSDDMRNAGAKRLSTYPDSDKSDGLKYGKVIMKCAILGGWNNFLIFDKTLAQAVYKQNWEVENQIKQIFGKNAQSDGDYLIRELKRRGVGHFRYEPYQDYGDARTGEAVQGLFKAGFGSDEYEKWEEFFRKHGVRGVIYHGGNDGYAFVCYNFSEVVPISVSYDNGETFTTGTQSWSDRSGTYETKGIDWESTHNRLQYGGDPLNKIGSKYKSVSSFPKKITLSSGGFGCVNVEKNNGKFNCVRTDTWEEIFPIDFDDEPSISRFGAVKFTYKGYSFDGGLEFNGNQICYFEVDGQAYGMDQIDAVIDYYTNGANKSDGEYEEQDDSATDQQLQEEFFRMLDRIELI